MSHSAAPQEAGIVRAGLGMPRLSVPLWPHQERALAAFEAGQASGDRSAYIVVPPGGGKTLIGLEAARRTGRKTLVLCPSTAIQAQWIGQWETAFGPPGPAADWPAWHERATASRDLPTPLTVLTYQAVASFDYSRPARPSADRAPAPPVPGRGRGRGDASGDLLAALHPNGRQLIARLQASGPWTLVLDECHHLLEIWGRLLSALVASLDSPIVIGLTATPPHLMTADQAAVHRELFGTVDLEVSAPALVRDGHLAPYQELAWLTPPTPAEADYIGGQALRFAELRAGLLDPGFASTPFLQWLQQRVVERPVDGAGTRISWERFATDSPALAAAALRLHADGLLPLPSGAVPREQHRHPPTAEDWVALLADYCKNCLLPSLEAGSDLDKSAYEAIRAALPSIGYRLTKTGIRAAESPVDRVLARSESKPLAAVEILRAEHAELGGLLRALVLTDYAEAGAATVGAALSGVLSDGAGGALLALRTLLADEATAALDPVLMTGQRVACGAPTAPRLLEWLRSAAPGLEVTAAPDGEAGTCVVTSGQGWEPRRYVPLVTRFFAEGGTRCLVGTRALLGEGWDAPAVNVTVDLTAATTPTAVVQARGRALRQDPGWPEKVADNWTVVCVTGAHPKGSADYDRFVRKHDRYFALAESGDIASGVAHVDPALSPFEPPDAAKLDEVNARMLIRAGTRPLVREWWNIGTPYADEPVATVTVAARRPLGLSQGVLARGAAARGAARLASDAAGGTAPAGGEPGPQEDAGALGMVALWVFSCVFSALGVLGIVIGHAWLPEVLLAANPVVLAVGQSAGRVRRAARIAAAPASGSVEDMAAATADALHEAGLVSRDAAALRIDPLPDGSYRARLTEVPATESATFAAALDEVMSPLAQPRYIVPRLFVAPPPDTRAALRLARRHPLAGHGSEEDGAPATVVYHAVPAVLGVNARLARIFARAWNARVSPGGMLYTGSAEGTGILAAQRGDDPFAVTTQIRTLWGLPARPDALVSGRRAR